MVSSPPSFVKLDGQSGERHLNSDHHMLLGQGNSNGRDCVFLEFLNRDVGLCTVATATVDEFDLGGGGVVKPPQSCLNGCVAHLSALLDSCLPDFPAASRL